MPLLGLAALLAGARLILWWRRAPTDMRARGWRLAALMLLQPIWAGLLLLVLLPPFLPGREGRLVVLTGNWGSAAGMAGDRRIALPEARAGADIERAPDLATALRRYPGTTALAIVGDGLEARDRPAATALPLAFAATAPPRGLTRLDPPHPVASGADFQVAGRVEGVKGSVELLDPAARRVDAMALSASGAFRLRGTARVPGDALFTLRVRDPGGMLVEEAEVPVRAVAQAPPRLLLLGSPGPDIKYLRRWASDAGLPADARMSTGGGVTLGDPPAPPMTLAGLQRVDVAIVDDRAWATMGVSGHAALVGAVREGMGLLLRVTGPVPEAVARDWRALGFGLGGGALVPLRLPGEAPDVPALRARRGTGTRDAPAALNADQNDAPPLTRSDVRIAAGDAVPLLREPWGASLGRWRAVGRGRAGVWTLVDSFALVLAGQGERYGAMWGAIVETLARPQGGGEAIIDALPGVGRRVAICRFAPHARLSSPGGATTAPIADPAARGCAAFWPQDAGWHSLVPPDAKAGTPISFYVWPRDRLRGVRATATRDATMALVNARPPGTRPAAAPGRRGSPWPWFLAWLVASGLLWWLERARAGRPVGEGTG